jgi:hypothetical protein
MVHGGANRREHGASIRDEPEEETVTAEQREGRRRLKKVWTATCSIDWRRIKTITFEQDVRPAHGGDEPPLIAGPKTVTIVYE